MISRRFWFVLSACQFVIGFIGLIPVAATAVFGSDARVTTATLMGCGLTAVVFIGSAFWALGEGRKAK
jgi:hypothetical protein